MLVDFSDRSATDCLHYDKPNIGYIEIPSRRNGLSQYPTDTLTKPVVEIEKGGLESLLFSESSICLPKILWNDIHSAMNLTLQASQETHTN